MDDKNLSFKVYSDFNVNLTDISTKLSQSLDFCINLQNRLNSIPSRIERIIQRNSDILVKQLAQLRYQTKQLRKYIETADNNTTKLLIQIENPCESQFDVELFEIYLYKATENIEHILLLKLSCEIQSVILLDYKLADIEHATFITEKCILNHDYINNTTNIIYLPNEGTVKTTVLLSSDNTGLIKEDTLFYKNAALPKHNYILQRPSRKIIDITKSKTFDNIIKKIKLNITLMITFCIVGIIISMLAVKYNFGFSPIISKVIALCFLSLLVTAIYSIFYCIKKLKRK